MEYLLFSYPNCRKCEQLKLFLQQSSLKGEELNLVHQEGKLKIRDYRQVLRRDDKGAVIIPTLILVEDGETRAVLNSQEELEDWLKSRA